MTSKKFNKADLGDLKLTKGVYDKVGRKKSLKPFRNICRLFQKPQLPMRWKKTHL